MHPLLVKGFTTVPRARQEAVSLGDLNLTNNQNKQTAVYRLTIRLAHCSEFVFSHLIPRPGFEKQFKKKNSIAHHPPPPAKSSPSLSLSLSLTRILIVCGSWSNMAMAAELVLKDACSGCGATLDLYGSGCRHLTLCAKCGKTMAETAAPCSDCGVPVTRLIRVRFLYPCPRFVCFFLLPSLAQHMFCFQQA
jgi:hypothetical protein